jgi:hypothetical protein
MMMHRLTPKVVITLLLMRLRQANLTQPNHSPPATASTPSLLSLSPFTSYFPHKALPPTYNSYTHMVDPVFVEQEPEPDIEAAIRRRSSLNQISNQPSDSPVALSRPAPVAAELPPLPIVTSRDHHRPVLRVRSTSERGGQYHHEKYGSASSSGGNRPLPSPESILGLPVRGQGPFDGTKNEAESGMELNRAETNETIPYPAEGAVDDDDEAVPEVTWKASFFVS